jgi:hypothetical protein
MHARCCRRRDLQASICSTNAVNTVRRSTWSYSAIFMAITCRIWRITQLRVSHEVLTSVTICSPGWIQVWQLGMCAFKWQAQFCYNSFQFSLSFFNSSFSKISIISTQQIWWTILPAIQIFPLRISTLGSHIYSHYHGA